MRVVMTLEIISEVDDGIKTSMEAEISADDNANRAGFGEHFAKFDHDAQKLFFAAVVGATSIKIESTETK